MTTPCFTSLASHPALHRALPFVERTTKTRSGSRQKQKGKDQTHSQASHTLEATRADKSKTVSERGEEVTRAAHLEQRGAPSERQCPPPPTPFYRAVPCPHLIEVSFKRGLGFGLLSSNVCRLVWIVENVKELRVLAHAREHAVVADMRDFGQILVVGGACKYN